MCGPEEFLFLGGDFNCTENDRLDRNHIEPHAASKLVMKQLVETHILTDVWREMHDQNRQYTWVQSRENVISMARLDRFYCFKHHFSIFEGCRILLVGFSDHCMVSCNIFIAILGTDLHTGTLTLLCYWMYILKKVLYFFGKFLEPEKKILFR